MHFPLLAPLVLLQISSFSLSRLEANIVEACIDTETNPALVTECETASARGYENSSDVRELFLKVPMGDAEMDSLLESQLEDGSWPDVDYINSGKGFWQASIHAFRVHRLAIKYRKDGSRKALAGALCGIDYWFEASPQPSNWWHREIGIPRIMGPAFLLLKTEMGPERMAKAAELMSAAKLHKTGQNRIWLAGNVLLRAVLMEDPQTAVRARDALLSEIAFRDGEEGLQRDFSFHQHGAQLQMGNYGLSYGATLSWWARVLEGTGLDFPLQEKDLLRQYLQNGLSELIYNGRFDPNACARHVFPNAQSGKALCVRYAAINLGMGTGSSESARYYPSSDFGVYRGKGWYASLRMQSSRTIGFENVNEENMKGYFSSDGALLVRVDGNEYDNIWPVWNWHHIPGATTWDDGFPIWGNRCGNAAPSSPPYNKSSKVSGLVSNRCMIAAMDFDRDSLTCKKAWFFYENGIVCLGAGITKPGASTVTTTVEQNLLKGSVKKGKDYAYHRGISYIILEGSAWSVSSGEQQGKWSWMGPELSGEDVALPVFEMTISHGASPSGASYAYAVFPGERPRDAKRCLKTVQILSNTTERQSVSIDGNVLTVIWEPFSLTAVREEK